MRNQLLTIIVPLTIIYITDAIIRNIKWYENNNHEKKKVQSQMPMKISRTIKFYEELINFLNFQHNKLKTNLKSKQAKISNIINSNIVHDKASVIENINWTKI